jgi:hypothetical protein
MLSTDNALRKHPYVVVHVAVSLDGSTTGFSVDIGRFYSLLPTWHEEITLTGADTIRPGTGACHRSAAGAH